MEAHKIELENHMALSETGLLRMRIADMRRDDDKIRDLMLKIEAHHDPIYHYNICRDSPKEDREVYYHLQLLCDAGFLEETKAHSGAFRMTNAGHDFVGFMHDDGLWAKMKSHATSVAPRYGLKLLFEIGDTVVRQKLIELGIPLK